MRYLVTAAFVLFSIVCLGCRPAPSASASAPKSSMTLCQPTVAEPVRPAPTAKSVANLAEADRLYKEGLDYYQKGRPGSPNSNSHLQQASKRFRAALLIYERAAKDDPKDQKLQQRIQDCNIKIYACAKMQTL
jgi:hypothetical protein